MRKISLVVGILLVSMIFSVGLSFGAGSVTVTVDRISLSEEVSPKKVVTLSWTADTDGSIPDTEINVTTHKLIGWFLYQVEKSDGSPSPSVYDVVIENPAGNDLAGGLLADRAISDYKIFNVSNPTAYPSQGYPMVRGNLTVKFTNQTVNSAKGILVLIFVPKPY